MNGHLQDTSCSEELCTLCNLKKRPEFELRGFCASESLGVKYYMNVDDTFLGVYDILGWRSTSLNWNLENHRWEFVELRNKNIVAFCNDTLEYPFGDQR